LSNSLAATGTQMSNSLPRACVIGWPIAHSRSPAIHRFWLNELGLAGDYVPVAVPAEQITSFLQSFPNSGFVGGNVTVPHKEAAFAAVGVAEAAAEAVGAVNTLWIDGGTLYGDNTDSSGFLANLDMASENWDKPSGPAVVLGAGGAARAVIHALIHRRFAPIHLINRTVARAEDLATRFGDAVRPAGWEAAERLLDGARLLVNTTTLGMKGSPWPRLDIARLPDDAVVTDLVYVPLETPLLAAARARGLRAVDGLGMLLHQAVPGFERWFGRRPAVSPALRAEILKTLEA
jgi:shikimate dehydrogenase